MIPDSTSSAARIAVVGGGLGGLVLAAVLHRGGLSATVYERDDSRDARGQGGSLDLHPESGQRALAAAGLQGRFRRHARPAGEALRIVDPQATLHVAKSPPPASDHADDADPDAVLDGRPEIDREILRSLLLDALPAGAVRWGRRLVAAEPGDGGHTLRFADGTVAGCDVLVGADGARSAVRPLLTPTEPTDTGIVYAELWLRDVDARPEVARFIGAGSVWCLGDNLNVSAQRVGAGDARVSVMLREGAGAPPPPAVAAAVASTRGAEPAGLRRADLLDLLAGWSPQVLDLIVAAEDDVVLRRLFTLPVGLRWRPRPGITLLGDAAHLMPPVGEGANQAMLDGAELGRLLLDRRDDPAAAVVAFEAAMHDRVEPIAARSARVQAMVLSGTSLASMTRMFGGALAR